MMPYKFGEIVLVPFPFNENDKGKLRTEIHAILG